MNTNIENNFDIIIGVDKRGVAHVLKHRFHATNAVTAEVKLTATTTSVETFGSEPKDTGLLESQAPSQADVAIAASVKSARVAVDATNIRQLLTDAANTAGQWVRISGTKTDGTSYHSRLVYPTFISENHVVVDDAESNEQRTFRLDGIERVALTPPTSSR